MPQSGQLWILLVGKARAKELLLQSESDDRQRAIASTRKLLACIQLAVEAIVSICGEYFGNAAEALLYIFIFENYNAIIKGVLIAEGVCIKQKAKHHQHQCLHPEVIYSKWFSHRNRRRED